MHDLDRDFTIELQIMGEEYRGHTPPPELRQDLIVAQRRSLQLLHEPLGRGPTVGHAVLRWLRVRMYSRPGSSATRQASPITWVYSGSCSATVRTRLSTKKG